MDFEIKKGSFLNYGAYHRKGGTEFTIVSRREGGLSILLYDRHDNTKIKEIALDKTFSVGRVYSAYFPKLKGEVCYLLKDRDGVYLDPYAPIVCGREKWNDTSRKENNFTVYGGVGDTCADYNESIHSVADEDMVIYKLHMRGFTESNGLSAGLKGNYKGIIKKIPYLKEMGITSVLFMPIYDFEEIRFHSFKVTEPDDTIGEMTSDPYGVNYWGYGDASYFAPKASYFPGNPQKGMDALVNTIHKAGMEMLMEFSFTSEKVINNPRFIANILIYWHMRYKVDGFHLIGEGLPIGFLLRHPKLSDVKIFYNRADEREFTHEEHKRFFYYNDDFIYPLRRLENHMDGSVAELANQMRKQGDKFGFVNYAAEKTGFTLLDAYSYGEKHNEANGEDNRDGSNYNCSSNHGYEGKTNSRNVNKKRYTCVRTDLTLLFMSQSVPLITEGDESLNSADGNNNPYGQDNAVGWAQFSNKKDARLLREFVKKLSAFRKAHPALRSSKPMKQNDYIGCGLPDLSYHDSEPWIMGIGPEKKGLGVMYAGAYAGDESEDVMVLINFYYEDREYALPGLNGDRHWYLCVNTAEEKFPDQQRECTEDRITVPGGTVSVLVGR